MERKLLAACVDQRLSSREIASRLGTSQTNVRYWLKKHELSTRQPLKAGLLTVSDAQLIEAVAASDSMAEVMRAVDRPNNGAAREGVAKRIALLDLSTTHFTRKRTRSVRTSFDPAKWLVLQELGLPKASAHALRRALIETGRSHECEGCGNDGFWMGSPITLEIDHINGSRRDNRRENLRFLCPNCHTQTPTYGFTGARDGLSIAARKALRVCSCGSPKDPSSKTCRGCVNHEGSTVRLVAMNKARAKVHWPRPNTLAAEIALHGQTAVGKMYGVTDGAVHKRMLKYPA